MRIINELNQSTIHWLLFIANCNKVNRSSKVMCADQKEDNRIVTAFSTFNSVRAFTESNSRINWKKAAIALSHTVRYCLLINDFPVEMCKYVCANCVSNKRNHQQLPLIHAYGQILSFACEPWRFMHINSQCSWSVFHDAQAKSASIFLSLFEQYTLSTVDFVTQN